MDALAELAPDAIFIFMLIGMAALVWLVDAYFFCKKVDRDTDRQ